MTQEQVTIYSADGTALATVSIGEGSKGRFSLMQEDSITLKFSLPYDSPVVFKPGSYVDLSQIMDDAQGGRMAKVYEVTDTQSPTYNKTTGGWDYELEMNAYYWKWANKICKYTPESGGQEASWNLTAALDVQLDIVLRNLVALGYTYSNGSAFTYEIDSTVEDKAVLMSYDNLSILDALFTMADEDHWDCDCWIAENVIHFGRLETGDAVTLEIGVQASDMTRSDSKGTFATRIYVFGSDRNIPSSYRPVDSDDTIAGVVVKRLMLPEGTSYIDAYRYIDGEKVYIGEEGYDSGTEMPQEEAIESVVTNDEIYPRTKCVVGSVGTYTDTTTDEDTGEEVTQTFYYVTDTSGLEFDEDYILDGEELRMVFTSGSLNGMDFGVTFREAGTTLNGETLESDVYEIVMNDDYGRDLPDEILCPAVGDTFVLYGWDSTAISELGLVDDAEQELYEYGVEYVKAAVMKDSTFEVTLASNWVYADEINRTFDIGQLVSLVNGAFFESPRETRIIGFEFNLDIPFDAPKYTCGETAQYSRIGQLEDDVDSLTYATYGSGGTSSGSSSVTIIKTNDSTAASNYNVYSALRSLAMFLRKDTDDTASGVITFLKGILFGENGLFSIDENGNAVLNDAVLSGSLTTGGDATVGGDVTVSGDVKSSNFSEAEQSGFGIVKNSSGKWNAFFTNLTIWGKAIFNELEIRKLSAVGGSIVLSAASSKILLVEDYYVDGEMVGWKCWYLADDGTTATQNGWQVGDQARCQSFNIEEGVYENVGNKDYWRCVILVSSENEKIYDDDGNELYDGQEFGWIVLSLTNAQASDYGSTYSGASWDEEYAYLSTPAAYDTIVLEGHQIQDDDNSDELNRMNLIILTAADDDPKILMYQGIYTFSLEGRLVVQLAGSGTIINNSYFEWVSEGVTVPNYIDMGEWTDGCTAGQYTIWYYNGETWRFDGYTDEDGNVITSTTEAPSEGASGWVRLTYTNTSEIAKAIFIELSLGGQMYYDETETVTLSVWDVTKTTEYTSDYTFSVERDSGDDSSDAVWNAAFAANYDGGTTFTISFSDLNFVDGSRTTKFWVYATENDTDEQLEEALIEY